MMRRALWPIVSIISLVGVAGCGSAAKKHQSTPDADRTAVPWEASGLDWSRVPAAGPDHAYQVPEPATFRLENGMTAIVAANRRLPLVSVQLVNPLAGSMRDPTELKGLAALTADMLDEGAGKWSALELAGEAERLGAFLETSAGVEATYVTMDTLGTTIERSLELVAAVVASPTLTEADFERVKDDQLSMVKRRRDRLDSVASLIFDRVVFGGHAYGLPNSGTEASVRRITRDDVRQFYADHYTPERTAVILVGDVDPETARPLLEATLGKWQQRAVAPIEPNLTLPRSRPPRLVVCDKPGAQQSAIRLGRVGLRRSDPRYFDAVVLNTAFGGSYTSRLSHRLREQLGYTYGVQSTFWFGRESGTWRVHTSVKTGNTVDAVREILQMLRDVREAGIPADELARAKKYLIGQLPQEFESNTATAESFADLVVHGLPIAWYAGYRKGIAGASSARGRELAAQSWQPEQLQLIVVGDLKKILDSLLALGFGSALEVDTEGNPIRSHPAE